MQAVCGTHQQPPAVTEKCPVAGSAAGARGQIGNNDNIEFQTFRLMNGKQTDNLIGLGNNLSFRFPDARVVRAIAQMSNDIVESDNSLPRKFPSDLDEFADVRDALPAVLLSHHDGIEIRLSNHILKNLRSRRGVAS